MGDVNAPVVGRDAELSRLAELVGGTSAGHGSAALVFGDAGMGKTRLLREMTRRASDAGVRIAWGHAVDDDAAPPLWPWAQVLRTAAASTDEAVDVGPGASILADAVAGIAADLAPFTRLDVAPANAGFYLRDAATRLLVAVSATTPLLIVLDDLHWADLASLRMAAHIAERVTDAVDPGALSFVAASRVEAPSNVHDLSASVLTMRLGPLSHDDCSRLASAVGASLTQDQTSTLHAATGGVPLFVDSALRRGDHGTNTALAAPDTVGSVEGREVLEAASVLGTTFDVDVVARMAGRPADTIRDALDVAVRSGIVDQLADKAHAPTTRMAFRHALVARSFYDTIEAPRRSELHLAAARAIEAGWEHERSVAERAHHLVAALPNGDHLAAARAAAAAAREATARHAHDDAARWYRRAAEAIPATEGEERCDLLIAASVSLLHGSGVAEAADGFADAAEAAEALADSRRRLSALVGVTEARYRAPGLDVDDRTRQHLTEAAARVSGDVGLQAAAAEQVARLETFMGQTERAVAAAAAAADAAVEAGDPVAVTIAARAARWAAVGPVALTAKYSASAALLMSEVELNPEIRWDAHQWTMLDAMESGDRRGMDASLSACHRVVEVLREPFMTSLTHAWAAAVAMMQGRFDDAGTAIDTALAIMEPAGVVPAGVHTHMAWLARDRGEIDGLDELLVGVSDAVPESSTTYRAALAMVYADQGRTDRARAELDRIRAGGFDRLAVNGLWLTTLAMCAETCSTLDHREAAAEMLPLLMDFADRSVVSGGGPYLYLGAVTHHLGSLSTTAGDPDGALGWLDDAADVHRRMGADAWTARTEFEMGRALVRLGGASTDAGRTCLATAAEMADRLGMVTLACRARSTGSDPETLSSVFSSADGGWRIDFAGRRVALADSKGLRVLHHLLGCPGVAVPAPDLVVAALGECASSPEQARVNVTRQLRSAIERLKTHAPELAQHLSTAVHTGHDCRYEPAVATPTWVLQ